MKLIPEGEEVEVLFWANLNPNKRGSFEDYVCRLSSLCREHGIRIKFVMGDQINDLLKPLFNQYRVDYFLISSEKFNSAWAMIWILRKIKPKIIHLNFIGFGSPQILACKAAGVERIILMEHSSTPLSAISPGDLGVLGLFRRIKRRYSISKIDHFAAVSKFVAERLHKRSGIPERKITVVYNGVDLDRFKPPENELEKAVLKKELFGINPSVSVVAFIGQLIEEKGVVVYLESIEKVLETRDDILFVFAGAGPLENLLLEKTKKARNGRIRFLRFRDDAEMILRASDILVVPSVWEEAFGLVIAEALACGVPVIGTRIGGIPELVLHQQTGILTKPGDVNELVQAIQKLVYDGEFREYLGAMGRKHVEKNFDVGMQAYKTLELYKHCLKTCKLLPPHG